MRILSIKSRKEVGDLSLFITISFESGMDSRGPSSSYLVLISDYKPDFIKGSLNAKLESNLISLHTRC